MRMEEIRLKRTLTVIGIVCGVVLVLAGLIVLTNDRINKAKDKKIMTEFKTLMSGKNVTVTEIIKYLDQNINNVSKENASILVLGLEQVQNANLPQWQEKYQNEALQDEMAKVYRNSGWNLADFSSIEGDLKKIVSETTGSGYKVETAEGYFFPVIDYDFYQKYYGAITPDLAAYLEIMAVESNQTPVKDAALMIGWEEILKRAVRQEQFIKEYSSSTQVEAMKQLLKRYVTFALFGANNTPLFSYDTKEIMPEAKAAYLKRSWDEETGSFSKLMSEYLRVLEKNNYRLTAEVADYRKNAAATFETAWR